MQALSEEADPEEIFDILDPIGEGAFGSVYKALDKRDGGLVALKIMPLEVEAGSLEKEVAIMKRCKSQHIVNFKGSFIKEGNIWLAMEYCSAGSVLDVIKATKEQLEEEEIRVVMKQVLRGLMYLHSNKLIHRDIKAGNILLNTKGQCKLADFGISKPFENSMNAGKTVIGTPYWMAPEIFTDGKHNTKCDIWSLGITAIEMACGRPPHSDKSPLQVIFYIPRSDPPNLPEDQVDFSSEFREFVAKCCTKDPKKRPTAKELLSTDKWIGNAKSNVLIQRIVQKALPLVEAMRQKKKEEEQAKQREEEMMEMANYQSPSDGDGGDDQYNTSIQYQTSLMKGDEEDDKGPGYADGTMLMMEDEDMSTMLMTAGGDDGDGHGQDGDDSDIYADGTMLINDQETPRGGGGGGFDDDQKGDSDDDDAFADSTMLINDGVNNMAIKTPREVKRIGSVFEGVDMNALLPIPRDVTKDELFAIFKRLKKVTVSDQEKFESWYRAQIRKLDDRIRAME